MSADTLQQSVLHASHRPEVVAAVGRVYARLQDQIDARRPVCSASGRCCRFEEYGHRLYVTTMELAAFVRGKDGGKDEGGRMKDEKALGRTSLSSFILHPSSLSPGCPFQVEGLCSVHAIRPFGCRMFFCDATATQWQNEQYEHFHGRLKRLHGEMGVPYFYIEWREALRQLGLGQSAVAGAG